MATSSMTLLTRYGYDEDGDSCEEPHHELHGICVLQCLLNALLEQRWSERRLHYSLQVKSLASRKRGTARPCVTGSTTVSHFRHPNMRHCVRPLTDEKRMVLT